MNPRVLIEAAALASESKLGHAIVDGAESLSQNLWGASSRAAADSGSASVGGGFHSLQNIVASYKDVIPSTLSTSHLTQAGENQIASVLNVERSAALGIRLRSASEGWESSKFVFVTPRFEGKSVLPGVELTTESAGGNLGVYSVQRARLGCDAFPMSVSKAGTAVHEITHHEQAFLGVCRKADQFGIGCEASKEQVAKIIGELEKTNFIGLNELSVNNFISFRSGRQLTQAAAERADANLSSFSSLFGRPVVGTEIDRRLGNIEYYQRILEIPANESKAKEIIESLANPAERLKIGKDLYAAKTAEAESSDLIANIAQPSSNKWAPNQTLLVRENFSNLLEKLYAQNKRLSREWDIAYTNSLHEQEARFNGYVAQQAIRARMENVSTSWNYQSVNLEAIKF